MFTYLLSCVRCLRSCKYKTGIDPEGFQPDVCKCGGKRLVSNVRAAEPTIEYKQNNEN